MTKEDSQFKNCKEKIIMETHKHCKICGEIIKQTDLKLRVLIRVPTKEEVLNDKAYKLGCCVECVIKEGFKILNIIL